MTGLDPPKGLHKMKANKLSIKWQGYTPQNHNIKRFMEGVDPCHFIEEKVTSIILLSLKGMCVEI